MTTKSSGRDKVTFALTGPKEGGPSIDDLIALFRQLTGREPTAEDSRRARRVLERDGRRGKERRR